MKVAGYVARVAELLRRRLSLGLLRGGKGLRSWVAAFVLTALGAAGIMGMVIPAAAAAPTGRPLAVASTTVVADLVQQVAGPSWQVTSLMPADTDPHAFQPTPADARRLAGARLVVLVGAGLEGPALASFIRRAAGDASFLEVAPPVAVAWQEGQEGHDAHDHHGELDPHVWTSVPNVIRIVDALAGTLARLDPSGAAGYRARAAAYRERLQALDAWIRDEVARIAPERRLLVTNHEFLNYFAAEYGFQVVGTLLRSMSTLAEPSPADTARLLDQLRAYKVRAIFAEATVSPVLARRLAQDAGVAVVTLYSGSLGAPGSGADTYEGYMRTNVGRIVAALAGGSP